MRPILHFAIVAVLLLFASHRTYSQTPSCLSGVFFDQVCYLDIPDGKYFRIDPNGLPTQGPPTNSGNYVRWKFKANPGGSHTLITWDSGDPDSPNNATVQQFPFQVFYPVGVPELSGPSLVCVNEGNTQLTHNTITHLYDKSWQLTPSTAGSVNNSNVLVWSLGFTGTVKVKLIAEGWRNNDFKTDTISITRKANEPFTVKIVHDDEVCIGRDLTLRSDVSHSGAYEWRIDDNQAVQSAATYFQTTGILNTTYNLKVTPYGKSAGDCLTSMSPKSDEVDGRFDYDQVFPLGDISITTDLPFRCKGGTPSPFSFFATGDFNSRTWSVSSNNPNNPNPGSFNGDMLNWNSQFTGQVTVKLEVRGCDGVKTVTKEINVHQVPAHKTLSTPVPSVCANAKVQATVSPVPPLMLETFELWRVHHPGAANESTSLITTSHTNGWDVGYGTYFVKTVTPNCPIDVSDRVTVSLKSEDPVFTVSAGTIGDVTGGQLIQACEKSTVFITATGGTELEWFRYDKACDDVNINTIPPHLRFDFCHKRQLQPDGTPYDGLHEFPVYAGTQAKIVLKGNSTTCEGTFQETINVSAQPSLRFTGIVPELYERVEGPGTDTLNLDFQGMMYDHQWELNPTDAGDISSTGVITWNPTFRGTAELNVSMHDCGGMTTVKNNIAVYPILDNTENQVQTFIPQTEYQSIDDVRTYKEDPFKVRLAAAYFDGLGRNVQNVQYFGASPGRDIVELKRYDEFGRESVKNLPFARVHSLNYPTNAIIEQQSFYAAPPLYVTGDLKPYSKTEFEPSPLNRVVEQGAPGTSWHPETGNTIKKQYLLNDSTDVMLFTYDQSTGAISPTIAYYDENTLNCLKTIDEEGNDVLEYVDKSGKTVCKKVKAADDVYACTYYIYDNFGNLVVVIPPEGVNQIVGSH